MKLSDETYRKLLPIADGLAETISMIVRHDPDTSADLDGLKANAEDLFSKLLYIRACGGLKNETD